MKGVALAGAVAGLVEAGYDVPRVAGTSAGAVVAAVLAALRHAGEDLGRVVDVARTLDYAALRDRGPIADHLGPLTPVADALSLLLDDGVFEGDALHDWLAGVLRDLGVRTFGDLRADDDVEAQAGPAHRWRLVVTASDLSRRRLVRLPWDFEEYGLDPDEQEVARAVRASAAIPFYFEPVRLEPGDGGEASVLVDGGLLSNFPVWLFDRTDGRAPRWPTLGVRLSSRPGVVPPTHDVDGPVSLGLAVVATLLEACDARHIDEPCVVRRTVFVDTSDVSAVDFDISPERRDELVARGRAAARSFLAGWDWDAWQQDCVGAAAVRAATEGERREASA